MTEQINTTQDQLPTDYKQVIENARKAVDEAKRAYEATLDSCPHAFVPYHWPRAEEDVQCTLCGVTAAYCTKSPHGFCCFNSSDSAHEKHVRDCHSVDDDATCNYCGKWIPDERK